MGRFAVIGVPFAIYCTGVAVKAVLTFAVKGTPFGINNSLIQLLVLVGFSDSCAFDGVSSLWLEDTPSFCVNLGLRP